MAATSSEDHSLNIDSERKAKLIDKEIERRNGVIEKLTIGGISSENMIHVLVRILETKATVRDIKIYLDVSNNVLVFNYLFMFLVEQKNNLVSVTIIKGAAQYGDVPTDFLVEMAKVIKSCKNLHALHLDIVGSYTDLVPHLFKQLLADDIDNLKFLPDLRVLKVSVTDGASLELISLFVKMRLSRKFFEHLDTLTLYIKDNTMHVTEKVMSLVRTKYPFLRYLELKYASQDGSSPAGLRMHQRKELAHISEKLTADDPDVGIYLYTFKLDDPNLQNRETLKTFLDRMLVPNLKVKFLTVQYFPDSNILREDDKETFRQRLVNMNHKFCNIQGLWEPPKAMLKNVAYRRNLAARYREYVDEFERQRDGPKRDVFASLYHDYEDNLWM